MPNFKERSYQKELLDRDNIPFADIKRNMQELDFINLKLGGHAITLKGVKRLLQIYNGNDPLHIAEIGCGGGDNLRVIKKYLQQRNIPVQLTGIDINKECIAFAQQQKRNSEIDFIHSDYKNVVFKQKPHIIFSSLFCHHFIQEELIEMMHWMKANSKFGFFINDLHRHPLAYYSIQLLTKTFSKSYLVKNDAPLSVQRGFKKNDWQKIFADANLPNFKIQWQWAFRWLVIYKNEYTTTI
jgi:2-polyprenyl-3-methyl-5-hydroxy-6-metoxy-1,4-benzoquinol methylase